MQYILSIDQGTTGTTACLVETQNFTFVGKVNKEYPQIYPKPSWVEHNLNDIWKTVEDSTRELLAKFKIDQSKIVAIGITNQRETTCAFSKTGEPLGHAIVWQDCRTIDECEKLKLNGHEENIKNKTGLTLDPYFSATKIQWLLNHNERVIQAKKNKDLCFGTIDTFLLYKLTAGMAFKTDATNASRTMLYDIHQNKWSEELLELFGVDQSELPTVEDSFHVFGKTKGCAFLPDGIPITGILGDQQAALFGQAGIRSGDLKCTYGTGAFLLLNTGSKIIKSHNGLLTTIAYRYQGSSSYALEGSCYIAGAAVQWLRDNLKLIKKSSDIEALAREVQDLEEMKHVMFLPFFAGLGSPYWNASAKAAIVGMTRDTKEKHLAFAALEGIALSITDLVEALRLETKLSIKELKVDGGAAENDLLCQLQASFAQLKIIRPKVIETTAYGAALASLVGLGHVKLDQLDQLWKVDKEFDSEKKFENYAREKKNAWKQTIQKLYF